MEKVKWDRNATYVIEAAGAIRVVNIASNTSIIINGKTDPWQSLFSPTEILDMAIDDAYGNYEFLQEWT